MSKSMGEISTCLGYSSNWLSSIKHNMPEKYKWITSFDKDIYVSAIKAQEYSTKLQRDVEEIYYKFDKPSDFHKWAKAHEAYNSKTTIQASYHVDRTIFQLMEFPLSRTIRMIKKLESIRTKYKEYGKEY